jgi:hypothetical protein
MGYADRELEIVQLGSGGSLPRFSREFFLPRPLTDRFLSYIYQQTDTAREGSTS